MTNILQAYGIWAVFFLILLASMFMFRSSRTFIKNILALVIAILLCTALANIVFHIRVQKSPDPILCKEYLRTNRDVNAQFGTVQSIVLQQSPANITLAGPPQHDMLTFLVTGQKRDGELSVQFSRSNDSSSLCIEQITFRTNTFGRIKTVEAPNDTTWTSRFLMKQVEK